MPRNMSPLPLSDNPPVRGLNLVTPFYHTMLLQTAPDGRRSRIIATDRTQLPATARIIAQIKADSLLGPPSLFIALGTYLRPHGETDSIRFIQLSGERCSTLQMRALRAMYRNASITIVYASAETQGLLASSPLNMMPEYPRAVEVLPDFYIEIIDEQGAPVTHAGATGEMVVTMLAERLAFPLIRYRTGDIATVLAQENDKIVLDIGTRVADDVVRIDGGEIHLKELERAILAATDSRVLDFEAIVTEEIRGKKITPRLSIALIITKGANKTHEKDLAKRISAELRVNQNRSYADGAAAELYAPLVCTIADPESSHESKRRHLVDKRV
jgi:phenylacetate-coenzyme A ligase PaaK-like adenylate-forming protein